jgi:hypothetical protein
MGCREVLQDNRRQVEINLMNWEPPHTFINHLAADAYGGNLVIL